MRRRKKRSLLWVIIPIVVVGVFLLVMVYHLLDPNLYRNVLQKSLTAALNREVSIGKATLYWWGGVGMAFEDFRVKDRSQSFDLLRSKRLIIRLKLLPLLRREVRLKRVVIDHPTLHLIRNAKGQVNIFFEGPLTSEKLKETQKRIFEAIPSLFGGSLALREGEIFFSDESLGDSPLNTEIRSFNFEIAQVSYREAFPFRINGKMTHSGREGLFSIEGIIENIPEDLDFSRGRVEAEVKIKDIDTVPFWPYLKTLLPMKKISGILDLTGHYQGDFQGNFKTSAKMKLKELLFDYPQVFSSILEPKWVNIDLEVEYDSKDFKIPRCRVELPEIEVKAKGKIYDIGSKEMGMEAEASSSPFDIAEGKKFVPFRIITPDVSGPLSQAEGKGPVQIVSVRLSGRMPEIDHCDQLVNAHVLSVEMKLHGAWLKFPWNLPPLEDLKGRLLFEKGHLSLREVEGRIFHSTLDKIRGTFYELLHVPTLQVECQGKFDLRDLSSLAKTEGFPEAFRRPLSSLHILSGKANYSLSAKGILKPPLQFQHTGSYTLSKVRFHYPSIPFSVLIGEGQIRLSEKDLQWSEAKVEFGQSSLLMSGYWKHGEKNPSLEILTKGRINLKNLTALFQTPLFPEAVRLKTEEFQSLSGMGQISFKGKYDSRVSPFSFEGEFIPQEVSFSPKGMDLPLFFKEGLFSFSHLGVKFSKAKFTSGRSSLQVDGWIREGNMHLSTSGSLDLKTLHSFLQSPFFVTHGRDPLDGIQGLSGEAELRLTWVGKTTDGMKALKEGEGRLKKVFLRHQQIPVPLSDVEGFFRIRPGEIRFEKWSGKLGPSSLQASGVISGEISFGSPPSPSTSSRTKPSREPMQRFIFQIFSRQLDFDSLFPKKDSPSPTSFAKIKEWLSLWSFEGMVEVDQGNFRSLHFQDLKAELKTVDGKLFIRPFRCKGSGGDLWGEGWVLPTERGIKFEIYPRFSNMEAKAFFRALLQKEEEESIVLMGRVHIDRVELRGEGENSQKMKESLNGKWRLEIEDGVIERFNILSKIFSILNVLQLFKGRLPDLKTKGLPYRNITATFDVRDGIASTSDFLVDSDAIRITLIGKVDLIKNIMEARIGVHPLVTVDTILSNIPIAGYILTGKDKAFISYFYEVKGNLNDPTIEAIPLKTLEESTWGIIKRLLETPLKPFQKNSSSKD